MLSFSKADCRDHPGTKPERPSCGGQVLRAIPWASSSSFRHQTLRPPFEHDHVFGFVHLVNRTKHLTTRRRVKVMSCVNLYNLSTFPVQFSPLGRLILLPLRSICRTCIDNSILQFEIIPRNHSI